MSQSALETESNFINQFDNFAAVYRQVCVYCNINKLGIAKFLNCQALVQTGPQVELKSPQKKEKRRIWTLG